MAGAPADSLWGRFRDRHLFDYSRRALCIWLIVVAAGLLLLVPAVVTVSHEVSTWFPMLFAAIPVLLASQFPVRVPRTTVVFSVSDPFLFGTLAVLGPAPAVLIAAADGAVGAFRRSRRLSSRLFSPASALLGMSAAGLVFSLGGSLLPPAGISNSAGALLALCLAGFTHYAVNTGLQHVLIATKQGRRFTLHTFLGETAWMGAISVLGAFVGGLVAISTGRLGLQAVGVSAMTGLAVLLLIRLSVRRFEEEISLQESRVAEAQEAARLNQQRFTAAFTNAAGGLAIAAGDGRVLRVNRALCDLLQRKESDFLGSPFLDLLTPEDRQRVEPQLAELVGQPEGTVAAEVRLQRPEGEVWVSLHASPFEDPGASGIGLIYQVHDITERRETQRKLRFAAYHDGLTGLPNRLAFMTRLQEAIARHERDPDAGFAVLLLDLDRFKMVNDSLGHAAGNELLVEIGNRLRQCVRPEDRVARLGGDEFSVLLRGVSSQAEAMHMAQRVAATLNEPVQMSGTEFSVQASIGLTMSSLGRRNADEMIRDADIAMYDAKGRGRGRISVFDTSMHEYVANRLYMEAELRKAIGAGQITLAYQPIFDLELRRLLGFEALARWHHPEMGQVDVPRFIQLAEESGFIAQLTPWVIEMAALQMAGWQRVLPHAERLRMHVNVSARDLGLPGFTTSVATALARARLSGHALTLEITETSLMQSVEHALPVMEALRRIGVGFSIDDFGTGYSSLSYLSKLPIDSLKIDRSFVIGMDRGPQNVEIVRAIQRLGQTLHMQVIAEGVETPEHLDALRDIGVGAGQGYLFSRPLPPAMLLAHLEQAGVPAA